MASPQHMIKVFISSACGDGESKQKYNVMRKALKQAIEDTAIATVYLFEEAEASTITARQHYSTELADSDVCIFLIDNADGVPDGVQKEINIAKKYEIKSLFYFCTERSKEKTPLQNSLLGADFAKSREIDSFESFVEHGLQGLIDDIALIYHLYCKNKLSFPEDSGLAREENEINIQQVQMPLVAPKEAIGFLGVTKEYFADFVLNQRKGYTQTNEFDLWCSRFLPVVFEGKPITEINIALLLKALEATQTPQFHEAIVKRWEAIQLYYQNQIEEVIIALREALAIAKNNKLPDWFILDILIDLRNQQAVFYNSKNKYVSKLPEQMEIEESAAPLFYPLIDRSSKTLLEKLIEGLKEETIKSPYTMSWSDLSVYTDELAHIFAIAVYNGSLTHLLGINRLVGNLAYYLCERYGEWSFIKLLLKSAIIEGKKKNIDGITSKYDVLRYLDADDAKEIMEFSNIVSIDLERLIANAEAFKIVGYYLSDADFAYYSDDLFMRIKLWLDGNGCISAESHIFDTINNTCYRVSQDSIAKFCIEIFERGFKRYYRETFILLSSSIDLDTMTVDLREQLLGYIVRIIETKDAIQDEDVVKEMLYMLRKKYPAYTDTMDSAVQTFMPEFYLGEYLLETTQNKEADLPQFIDQNISKIKHRNESQGKNGIFSDYADNPYQIIKNIINHNSGITFTNTLLDDAFCASIETILSDKQSTEIKCDAIVLIIFLCQKTPEIINRNYQQVERLIANKHAIEHGAAIISNLTDIPLKISVLFLFECFGHDTVLDLMNLLPYTDGDVPAQIKVEKTILSYLEADKDKMPTSTMEVVLLQYSLKWSKAENKDVRWYSIKILFELLRNSALSGVIHSQLVDSMDSDTPHIKTLILRQIREHGLSDESVRDYILQKAKIDANFVVRKVVS